MNVFDIIPSDFFNCLAGKSNNRVYADYLELIHNQYDKEISYRLERAYLRDVLAAFLLENHLDLSDEENTANAGNDEANFVLRKFISVGWLEEDQDDSTFEKYIVMTDNGIALAEFLQKLNTHRQKSKEKQLGRFCSHQGYGIQQEVQDQRHNELHRQHHTNKKTA